MTKSADSLFKASLQTHRQLKRNGTLKIRRGGNPITKNKFPANIYLLKINIKNTRKTRKICLELTIKTPERRHWRRSGVFIVNFEHISHLFLVFLLLTLKKC